MGRQEHDDGPGQRPRPPRSGTEPLTARSDLPLRLLLSVVFVPLFALATVGFAFWWSRAGSGDSPSPEALRLLALGCGALTVFAAVDLAAVLRRLRRNARG